MPTIGWTQADYDTLKAAVASGVLTVVYAGPPQRSITYQSLSEMRKLLGDMARELNATASPPYRRVTFNKGFDPSGNGCG